MKTVALNRAELRYAVMTGGDRRIESILGGWNAQQHFKTDKPWEVDMEGACGEIAVAKVLGLFFDGSVNTFKRPDVGPYQVRTTDLPTKSLIIRPGDPDDQIYILVAGRVPAYTVVGYYRAKDAKVRSDWYAVKGRGGEPAWWVPAAALHPIEDLILIPVDPYVTCDTAPEDHPFLGEEISLI